MRRLQVLLAAGAFLASTGLARAEDDTWAALARRIVMTDRYGSFSVTLGAEPPGFVFPLPARPALPLLGSTWLAEVKNGAPLAAHVYYAPTSHTGSASESLFPQLAAAGYTKLANPKDRFPSFTEGRRVVKMCPRDLRQPSVDVAIDRIDGLPAMDLEFRLHADSTDCRDAVTAPAIKSHTPVLTGIPGVAFTARLMTPEVVPRSTPFSTGTARTSLSAEEAVAKIAERFAAKGWTAAPAVVAGEIITQRFTFASAARRFDTLLVFDRRAPGVYDVLFALTDAALDRAAG